MRIFIRTMLKKNGYTVVGEALSGAETINMYRKLRPDDWHIEQTVNRAF